MNTIYYMECYLFLDFSSPKLGKYRGVVGYSGFEHHGKYTSSIFTEFLTDEPFLVVHYTSTGISCHRDRVKIF